MAIQPMYDHAQAMTASSSASQSEFAQTILTPHYNPSNPVGGFSPPITGASANFEFDPMAATFAGMPMPPMSPGPIGAAIPGSPFDFVGPLNVPVFNSTRMTGNYGPAAAGAAVRNCNNPYARTIYIGGFPEGTDVDQVLSLVHFGPLEEIKVPKNGQCLFISFLNGAVAAAFLADAHVKKIAIRGNALHVNMAREQPWMNREVVNAVMTQEATRTVYIPNIDPEMSEDDISAEMRAFGDVDIVKVVRNQQNAFVHFFSIKKAMEVVEVLRHSGKYCRDGKQVGFGKDRCAFVPKTQAHNVEITMRQACMAAEAEIGRAHFGNMYNPDSVKYNNPIAFNPMFNRPSPFQNPGMPGLDSTFSQPKRSVFLGNIPESATHEDLCNVIRGGNLEHIRYLPAKQCAFATFVDPACANTFFNSAQAQGVVVKGFRLRVGWGTRDSRDDHLTPGSNKKKSTLTRNVYVGGIKDFDKYTEEKLRRDFSVYGEVEMINFLKEKAAAFVNFTSIPAAVKAIEQIPIDNSDYVALNLNHGKDRCAGPPREFRHFANRPASTRPEAMRSDPTPAEQAAAEEATAATSASAPVVEQGELVSAN